MQKKKPSKRNTPAFEAEKTVFATKLRECMKVRGENQTTLAEKIGVQRQTISLYMNGQSSPNTETLTAIAKALDVSTDWLLGLRDDMSNDVTEQNIHDLTGLSSIAIRNLIGSYNYASLKIIETVNVLLEQEDIWKFFAPESNNFTGENLFLTIADFLYSPEVQGKLTLTDDGCLVKSENIKITDEYGISFRKGYVCELNANELIDKVRTDRIIDILKNIRSTVQRSNGNNL